MTEARSYDEINAEQVAGFREAVQQAMGASDQQQADASGWVAAGMPADMTVTQPGPHQHD